MKQNVYKTTIEKIFHDDINHMISSIFILLILFVVFVVVFALQNLFTKPLIPKVIHKIYIEHSMKLPETFPSEIQGAHDSWKRLNPDYKIRYYDGTSCIHYLSKHFHPRFVRAFEKLKPYSYKCDFMRYCILYIDGGVYTDWKMVCHKPLDQLIHKNTKWVTAWDVGPKNMLNGFIACPPKAPIIRKAIELCLYNIENDIYGNGALYPTGPTLLGRAFKHTYPNYPSNKQTDGEDTDIILGYLKSRKLFFNDIRFFDSKCEMCSKSQDWINGNNYALMWKNSNVYAK
jgi:mannosyltransferase OCH1-like enzyme